jgi:ABC-type branched-subunit amino acid transport system substrate-binding protein
MKKLFLTFGLLVAIALGGCDDAPQTGKPVVTIVALYPMSGDAAIYGETSRKITDWFLADFDKNNPNAKYKYHVVFEDIQMSPVAALNAVNKHISKKDTDVFVNMLSSVSQVIAPVTNKNKIPTLNFVADNSGNMGDYNFRITVDVPAGVTRLLDKMEKQGIKKIAIVHQIEQSHIIPAEEMLLQIKNRKNFTLTGHYQFNAGEKDFAILIQKIAREHPDMIVVGANPPESDLFAMAVKKQKVSIPLTGFQFPETVVNKSLVEGMWGLETATANKEFKDKFKEIVGGDSTYYSEYTYAMLDVITNAYEKIGTGTKPINDMLVKSILENTINLKSPFGKLNINPKTGDIFVPTEIRQVKTACRLL